MAITSKSLTMEGAATIKRQRLLRAVEETSL